jgi:intracellular sulfur oxidation DsrE/DsrF family protein
MLHAMKKLLQILSTLFAIGWLGFAVAPVNAANAAATNPSATAKPSKNRLVIQISEDDTKKWNTVMGNLHNIQSELAKEGVAITVVAIGGGLGMLTAESLVANRVEEAIADGVRFVACGNSMAAQQVTKDDLTKGVHATKSGYVEIMRLQQQGWIYLRP